MPYERRSYPTKTAPTQETLTCPKGNNVVRALKKPQSPLASATRPGQVVIPQGGHLAPGVSCRRVEARATCVEEEEEKEEEKKEEEEEEKRKAVRCLWVQCSQGWVFVSAAVTSGGFIDRPPS
ncbi:hypothetical protein E2C01_078702 [Portunus trituberculatus]|uniref:Uncharacterized protein n=1 Tax=Portunus trituberculatus TaxID=210409 RepID=A0A5B7ITI5_PORTR|nr:hypothetical protein [Portunus trituberculatus]